MIRFRLIKIYVEFSQEWDSTFNGLRLLYSWGLQNSSHAATPHRLLKLYKGIWSESETSDFKDVSINRSNLLLPSRIYGNGKLRPEQICNVSKFWYNRPGESHFLSAIELLFPSLLQSSSVNRKFSTQRYYLNHV